MKPPNADPRNKSAKKLLKKLTRNEKRYLVGHKNSQRARIVQAVHAGHVRGGHSFH